MSCLCTNHLYQQSAAIIQLLKAEQQENSIIDQMYLIGDAPIAAAECVGQYLQRFLLNDGKLHVPSSLRVADAAASGRIQKVLLGASRISHRYTHTRVREGTFSIA